VRKFEADDEKRATQQDCLWLLNSSQGTYKPDIRANARRHRRAIALGIIVCRRWCWHRCSCFCLVVVFRDKRCLRVQTSSLHLLFPCRIAVSPSRVGRVICSSILKRMHNQHWKVCFFGYRLISICTVRVTQSGGLSELMLVDFPGTLAVAHGLAWHGEHGKFALSEPVSIEESKLEGMN